MKRIISLALLMVALAGCSGLPPTAESAIRDGIAVNQGHAGDEGLPQPAREIAQDNEDLLWDVLYRAGSINELPAAVRARKAARSGGSK